MKVVYLNNYHYIRGGSERVFFGEMDMMEREGHPVAGYARSHPLDLPSDHNQYFPPDMVTDKTGLSRETLRTLREIFYSISAKNGLGRLISRFEPDIAHLHNIYGRLTTSVLDLLAQRRIPVVMSLHDYKLACPSYLFMNDGTVCEDCRGAKYYMAVRNRCHKNSYSASAIVALESYLNHWRGTYRKKVDCFIAPSRFLKNKLIEHGWPADRIRHVANFIDTAGFEPNFEPGDYFLYLGRLSEEKGVDVLIEAFIRADTARVGLKIVGDGPSRTRLEKSAGSGTGIAFAGYLSGAKLRDVTRNALAVIVPSVCYENAPLSVLEAMAYGKPVIGARIGGIPELITEGVTGFLFEPGDRLSLKIAMETIADLTPDDIQSMGMTARRAVEAHYSTTVHCRQIEAIYRRIIDEKGIQGCISSISQ
ncbi:MAG: glycosyltransferase [Pseudomonadota bacterium]